MSEVLFDKPILASAGLSAELDHLYVTDFTQDKEVDVTGIAKKFEHAYRFAIAYKNAYNIDDGSMSTVHMLDDYHYDINSKSNLRPQECLQRLVDGAERAAIPLDYITREGAFVLHAEEVLRRIRLIAKPVHEDNWEADEWVRCERRYFNDRVEHVYGRIIEDHVRQDPAMKDCRGREHIDIQMYNTKRHRKTGKHVLKDGLPQVEEWARPFLASISEMARLGIVNSPDLEPYLIDKNNLPDFERWDSYPAVMQLNPDAAPMRAKHIVNIVPKAYGPVEKAVNILISAVDPGAADRSGWLYL